MQLATLEPKTPSAVAERRLAHARRRRATEAPQNGERIRDALSDDPREFIRRSRQLAGE